MTDLRSKLIRLAHAKPELRPALLPLLKTGSFPRVVKEVEDDYRRKAITVGEKNELLAAIENAETEQEAKKLVADHRKGRVATILSDEDKAQVDQVKALVKSNGGKNPYLKKWSGMGPKPWTIVFVKPPPSRASARRQGLSDGEPRVYYWGGGSLKQGNPKMEFFATEDEANASVKDVLSEVRKYHPGDDIFIMGW